MDISPRPKRRREREVGREKQGKRSREREGGRGSSGGGRSEKGSVAE